MNDETNLDMDADFNHAHPEAQSAPSQRPQPLCNALEPTLALLALGAISANSVEALAAREHLAGCAWCQRRLREYGATRDALRQLGAAAGAQVARQGWEAPTTLGATDGHTPTIEMSVSKPASPLETLDVEQIMRLSEQREPSEQDAALPPPASFGAHAPTIAQSSRPAAARAGWRRPFRRAPIAWAAVAAALVVAVLVGLLATVRNANTQTGVVVVNGCPTGTQRVTEFQSIGGYRGTVDIVPGPGCSLYATGVHVWRVTTDGKFTSYPHLSSTAIASGPDGSLWAFTPQGLIHLNPQTNATRAYPIPATLSFAFPLRVAKDGSVWFPATVVTQNGAPTGEAIVRLDPATGALRQFAIPGLQPTQALYISEMLIGPDGAVWWATQPRSSVDTGWIERLNPVSGAIVSYHMPFFPATFLTPPTSGSSASYLTIGPDGALWFVLTSLSGQPNRLGHLTALGAVAYFPLPASAIATTAMTLGPDGAFWIAAGANGYSKNGILLRVTPQGHVSTYSWFPRLDAKALGGYPVAITTGPDHRLWVIYALEEQPGVGHAGGAASGGPLDFRVMRVALPPGV